MRWMIGLGLAYFIMLFAVTGCPSANVVDWPTERLDNNPSTQPAAVQVADMDGDGHLDAVSVWRGSPSGTGRLGVAAVHFQIPDTGWTTSIIDSNVRYANANALTLADVNNDQHMDVVVANGDRITYLRAPADARVVTAWEVFDIAASIDSSSKAWFDVAAAQIDGKNGLDIVAALNDVGRLVWFESPADPDTADGWLIHSIDSTTRAGADSLVLIDMNGDGKVDVASSATGDSSGVISWYEQPADPTTTPWPKHIMTSFSGATRFAFGDLDGDGKVDMAALSPSRAQIAWFPHPAQATDVWNGWVLADYTKDSTDTREPLDIAIADMNGNGRKDVVVLSNNPASIFYYSPGSDNEGPWIESRIVAIAPNGFGLFTVSDILGRGLNDVIAPVIQDDDNTRDRINRFISPGH